LFTRYINVFILICTIIFTSNNIYKWWCFILITNELRSNYNLNETWSPTRTYLYGELEWERNVPKIVCGDPHEEFCSSRGRKWRVKTLEISPSWPPSQKSSLLSLTRDGNGDPIPDFPRGISLLEDGYVTNSHRGDLNVGNLIPAGFAAILPVPATRNFLSKLVNLLLKL
jgi:hypothetical protein